MPTLSDYTNVYREALKVLRDKGYQVWRADPWQMYCAEKDGWDFMADSPTALLGVVAIYEHKQPQRCTEYWWSSDPMPPYKVPTEPERAYISRIVSDREPRRPSPSMPPEAAPSNMGRSRSTDAATRGSSAAAAASRSERNAHARPTRAPRAGS